MNIAARNHCLRPMARALHGHNLCAEIAPKALSRLNFQVKQSGKFGLTDAKGTYDTAPLDLAAPIGLATGRLCRRRCNSRSPTRPKGSSRPFKGAFRRSPTCIGFSSTPDGQEPRCRVSSRKNLRPTLKT